MIRRHIIFYGWVQGVGFRYRARNAANLYGCTGWCRNEWDGSVTMEIQGTEAQIDSVILAIEAGRIVRIENMRSEQIPLLEDEK
ncbi:MAG: acylphosphatase [Oscillospiraceae bacterium]|nr:acylphosphatase [Oscillospiraceae bacterium]